MNFPAATRVWIYQSNRPFTDSELVVLQQALSNFTRGWSAHGNDLAAGFEIRYARFILLFVDESQAGATGCSIDKSVKLMKVIEEELGVTLFDRFHIAYKAGDAVVSVDRAGFEQKIASGEITGDTIVFNNLVATKGELDENWEVPFRDSWHPKVFGLPTKAETV